MSKNTESLASRYGKTLHEIIMELYGEEGTSKVEEQLKTLAVLCKGYAGRFFQSPVFDHREKEKVLESVLEKQIIDPALKRFLSVLVAQHHFHFLPQITLAFMDSAQEHRNETQARIRSAFPLNSTDREKLSETLGKVTGKKVLLDVTVDRDLIGGVVAEVGGIVYDASIQGYLNRLQEEFQP